MTATTDFQLDSCIIADVIQEAKAVSVFSFLDEEGEDKMISFSGKITTQGINSAQFGKGKKKKTVYSIGLAIDKETEDMITEYYDHVYSVVKESGYDQFEYKNPIVKGKKKEDSSIMYVKLKTNKAGDEFDFESNLTITPKKHSATEKYDKVTISTGISAWFGHNEEKDDWTAGICYQVDNIEFETDEPVKKKKKTSK